MTCFMRFSDDITHVIGTMLGTRDLVSFSYVSPVQDRTWTEHVRRRCGPDWIPGLKGIKRFMSCIYEHVCASTLNRSTIRDDAYQAYIANQLRQSSTYCARCLAVVAGTGTATGHDHGVSVRAGQLTHELWTGVRILSIAAVGGSLIWYVTVQHQLHEYCIVSRKKRTLCPGQHVYDVCGPVGVAGTGTGMWPLKGPRLVACTSVVQSDTCIAGWHVSGDLSVFSARTHRCMYVVDTGESQYIARSISIVGDVVRVSGRTWCDGHCTGKCAYDIRVARLGGRIMYVQTPYHLGCSVAA